MIYDDDASVSGTLPELRNWFNIHVVRNLLLSMNDGGVMLLLVLSGYLD